MQRTEEQLIYLIEMYHELIGALATRDQDLIIKAENEYNWFEEEDYPPYIPYHEEIEEVLSILHVKQDLLLEEWHQMRLREGIVHGNESQIYYESIIRNGDSTAVTNKLISNVLKSSLTEIEKENHVTRIKNAAFVCGVEI